MPEPAPPPESFPVAFCDTADEDAARIGSVWEQVLEESGGTGPA